MTGTYGQAGQPATPKAKVGGEGQAAAPSSPSSPAPAGGFATWLQALVREPVDSGLLPVVRKEFADHLNSVRFAILAMLVVLTTVASLYVAAQTIRSTVGSGQLGQFVFLRLFTTSDGTMPSFFAFLAFLIPLVGLTLGFDAINGEEARRTLSRLVAQPIHRDAVINGKFVAGLLVIALMLAVLGLLVSGLGMRMIGVFPTGDEVARLLTFFIVTLIYAAFWLALSLLFSVTFRQGATSALAGIAVWLFFALFGELLSDLIAAAIVGDAVATPQGQLRLEQMRIWFARVSPIYLYSEVTLALLLPTMRTLGPVTLGDLLGSLPGAPLPFGESLLLIWPQILALLGATLVVFCISYIVFMRREIRA